MNITDFLFRHKLDEAQFVQLVPVYNFQLSSPGFEWNQWTISVAILVTGVVVMGVRILLQLFSLQRIKSRATLLNEGTVKLFDVNEHIVPFSFNNGIYINRRLHTDVELQEIIRHEFVHIKQKHSIDILFAELLCMLLWFHPAAWLIRKAIRQNLEFIADEKVLQDGIDKKQYQYLLLKVAGNTNYSIAPNFNFSSLKNRIIMMNQIKSARVQLIRFLFVLPLLAVLLLAFREVRHTQQRNDYDQQKVLLSDTIPADQIAEIRVTKNNNQQSVTIVLKNGTLETYNLDDEKQKAAFEKKYGKLNPPPPPPKFNVEQNELEIQKNIQTVNVSKEKGQNIVRIRLKNGKEEVYNIDKIKEKEQMEAKYGKLTPPPPPPPPVVLNSKGYYLTVADDDGECVVIVKDKNKKIVKAMMLTDWTKEEAVNEKKYGKIPPPPPPAPDVPPAVSVVPPVSTTAAVSAPVQVGNTANVSVAKEVTVTGYGTKSPLEPVVAEGYAQTITTASGKTTKANKTTLGFRNGTIPDDILYIVDGKEAIYSEIQAIDPNTIESINVLKDDAAVKAYGSKGKNGVIIIKTKTKKTSFNFFTTPWKVENEKC
jgi:TonB-dependent SusC/RagA subfamily outer membrane receptor